MTDQRATSATELPEGREDPQAPVCTFPAEQGRLSPGPMPYGEYDSTGVDLSLLRWFLQLTPRQRLEQMERHARDTLLLYEYGRRHRQAKAAAHR